MKPFRIVYLFAFFFLCISSKAQTTTDQHSILPIDDNTGCFVRYYYYPNLEAYYDNLKKVFYYKVYGVWKTEEELPENLCGYSLFNKARVVITNYDDDEPQELLKEHRKLYPYNSKGRFTYSTAGLDKNDKSKNTQKTI